MPESSALSAQFASCASKLNALEGCFFLVSAATSWALRRDWVTVLFCVASVWSFIRAGRDRGRTYVEIRDGRLIVYEGRKPDLQINVDMNLVSEIHPGWNKTILMLRDDTKVAIDHSWFATGAEADRFRKFMEEANETQRA